MRRGLLGPDTEAEQKEVIIVKPSHNSTHTLFFPHKRDIAITIWHNLVIRSRRELGPLIAIPCTDAFRLVNGYLGGHIYGKRYRPGCVCVKCGRRNPSSEGKL